MRPSGPLPPRVYWVRRVLALAVLVLVISLVWWLVSAAGFTEDEPSASGDGRTTAADDDPDAGGTPGDEQPSGQPDPGSPATRTRPTDKPPDETTEKPDDDGQVPGQNGDRPDKPRKPKLAQPTGDCTPSGVDITIEVSDSRVGRSNSATLLLTSTQTPACTLSITPDLLLMKVTSGSDTIWSSDDCPDALRVQQLVVRADPATRYDFTWNGKRSADGCQANPGSIEPGGYWVKAALIGGLPHEAYFDLT